MDMILKNTFQSISPAYELIGDVTVASNTTQVDFTGLNIGKDDELLLVADWINGSVTSGLICLPNNIATNGGYKQQMYADNSGVGAVRGNDFSMEAMTSGKRGLFFIKIKLTNSGYYTHQSSGTSYYGQACVNVQSCATSTSTISSITSIKVQANTNCIATGSRFQLYKLVAEKVADIIVPSNTTSVDITGLNIGKDGEYYLVSEMNNVPSCLLYVNGNTANANYYVQRLFANSTTVGGSRTNNPVYIDGNVRYASTNIKLTNSGYFVYQTNQINSASSSDIQIWKGYGTSTFTSSSVNQLTITAGAANGILTNSRFTLYRMK